MKKNKTFFLTIIALAFIFYLLGHLVYGSKSIFSLFTLSRKKERLSKENIVLKEDKQNLEEKVKRMKSETLDMDTLDEQVRKNLGYSKEKEIIYVE
ncbi:MAG: septum formation initiator family protein [Rickettsiales bacterium]|nr:septum formation initiator family protein [Rickettsiales bacterium]